MASCGQELSREAFVARYGGIYEHSAWVAEQCFDEALDARTDALPTLFASCVDAADHDTKMRLIRAHPDLADSAAVRGELTAESRQEQAGAGIDQCTKEEFEQFVALNSAYKEKFEFPFIMAVKNSNRHDILAAFKTRIGNEVDSEFATAIREIHKIAKWRLEAL